MVATLAHAELTCKCLAPTDLVNAAETDSPTESVSHSPPETDATPADATRTERQLALRTSVPALTTEKRLTSVQKSMMIPARNAHA